jgi:hypothetical protein
MKKVMVVLLVALTVLLVACSSGDVRSNHRQIHITGINGIGFRNILPNDSVIGTPYGWDGIVFDYKDSRDSFAIISVPADEEDVEVYFNAIISPQKDIANIWVTTYRNNPPFSFKTNREIPITHREEIQINRIGIKGTFREYVQENIVFLGNDSEFRAVQMRNATPRQLNEAKLNTVYIMPYPWRTIKINIVIRSSSIANIHFNFGYDGGNVILSNGLDRTFNWLNSNVFNQAICKIERTSRDFDRLIILCNDVVDLSFFDEKERPYNPLTSERAASARIHFNGISNALFMRRMAYAIAFMMGVSENGNERNLMSRYNSTNAHDDTTQIHLNFKQWNQIQSSK